jgi:hypothetical protein
MATDGPTPPECARDIYEKGSAFLILGHWAGGSNSIESWCKRVAKKSEQRVDWHFVGGRAVFKVLGDFDKAVDAAQELLPLVGCEDEDGRNYARFRERYENDFPSEGTPAYEGILAFTKVFKHSGTPFGDEPRIESYPLKLELVDGEWTATFTLERTPIAPLVRRDPDPLEACRLILDVIRCLRILADMALASAGSEEAIYVAREVKILCSVALTYRQDD